MIDQSEIDEINSAERREIPEHFRTNEQFAYKAYEFASNWLIRDQHPELIPTWALLTERGRVVAIGTPFDAPAGHEASYKEFVATEMRNLMKELGVIRYSFASEAWVTKRTKEEFEKDNRPPSECDDRIEVVMIISVDDAGSFLRCFEIERDETGKIFNLKRTDTGAADSVAGGRFANLLEIPNES